MINTIYPILTTDGMQNFIHFADEGPKGTSKETLSLRFLWLSEGKTLLSWENKALPIGRGSAIADHRSHISEQIHACMTYLLISPKQIPSEPAALSTQHTTADFIWILVGLKLYQTLLRFGNPWRAAGGTDFISRYLSS